jgi:hypothetical protein
MQRLWFQTLFLVVIIGTVGCVQRALSAEQDTENTLDVSNKWNIEFTPYFWAAELDGDATLRGRTGPVEVSFSDLLDNLDIAFMGRLEAWNGKWGLFLDGLYMDLGCRGFNPPSAAILLRPLQLYL